VVILFEMAVFLTGDRLNTEIAEIITNPVDAEVILASPYMKFHDRIKRELIKLQSKPKISVKIIIGKSDGDFRKSIDNESLEVILNLPNVQILHENRLHAKFYSDGVRYILSSMNLYDFSQNNNIEFGVLFESGLLVNNQFAKDAIAFTKEVIDHAELIFENLPNFQSKRLGLSQEFTGFSNTINKIDNKKRGTERSTEKKSKPDTRHGFCIRSGERIPFNIDMPYTPKAFKVWSMYGDGTYPEKFCHATGEPSNGQTTFARPVLSKNWSRAEELMKGQ
jgi:hypothetical protein